MTSILVYTDYHRENEIALHPITIESGKLSIRIWETEDDALGLEEGVKDDAGNDDDGVLTSHCLPSLFRLI